MVQSPFFANVAMIALSVLVFRGTARSQGTGDSVEITRDQVRSLGSNIAGSCKQKVPVPASLVLQVEAGSGKTLVENALTEALTDSGYAVRLARGESNAKVLLHVLVLQQTVQHREVAAAGFERTIRSALDARLEFEDGNIVVLGPFSAETRDTVLQRGVPALPLQDASEDSDSSFLEKVFGPVFLITGTFLIVYLFFTVRS